MPKSGNCKHEYTFEQASGKLLKMTLSDANSNQAILEITDINYSYRPTETDFALPEDIS